MLPEVTLRCVALWHDPQYAKVRKGSKVYVNARSHFAWQTITLLKCFLLENGGGERVFSMYVNFKLCNVQFSVELEHYR